ncbi:MAG: hypothetical protein WC438_02345 [Candidatus Pacearchaeota archaeon]
MAKQTKVLSKRRKFYEVDVPLTRTKIELVGNSIEELKDKTIKLDLTRQLRGKSVEAVIKVKIDKNKAIAEPIKMKLMPYFIRRMIRKRISYIEDSFETPSQESMIIVKPFIITRKRVSRAVRKTIRNQARNWLQDYIAEKNDSEIFNEIFSNRMQKPLSLKLKKTYPLSLCEIRVLEIKRALREEEKPKITKKKEIKKEAEEMQGIDQLAEIEEEIKEQKIKEAEKEIKITQHEASELGTVKEEELEKTALDLKKEAEEDLTKKPKKERKKKEKTEEAKE